MVRRPGAAGRESVVPGLHLARSEDTVGCHNFRGSQVGGWVEARDAGQHPTKPWAAPHPKNYPAPNANSTEVDGLQTRASEHLLGAKSGHLDVLEPISRRLWKAVSSGRSVPICQGHLLKNGLCLGPDMHALLAQIV